MSNILMHHIDPQQNKARYYFIAVGPSLVDDYAVLRFWGRLGGQQQGLVTPCASPEEANKLARRLVRRRLRNGYQFVSGGEKFFERD